MSQPSDAELNVRVLGELARERHRSELRQKALETFVLYLFTYEMPIDRVRTLVDKVVTDSLGEFRILEKSGARREFVRELLERLSLVEDSHVGEEERCTKCGFPLVCEMFPGHACECWKSEASAPDPSASSQQPHAATEDETSSSTETPTTESPPPP